MTIYRDLHQHPELSMQETRSAAIMAAEARRLGFEVTDRCRRDRRRRGAQERRWAGADAARRHGRASGRGADRPAVRQPRSRDQFRRSRQRRSCMPAATTLTWRPGSARRDASSRCAVIWSGTLVMIGQPGEEIGRGAMAMLDRRAVHALSQADTRDRLSRRRAPAGGRDRLFGRPSAGQRRFGRYPGARAGRPWRCPAHDPRPDRARQPDRDDAPDAGEPRARPA